MGPWRAHEAVTRCKEGVECLSVSLKLCLHNILSYCVFAGQQNIPMPPRPSSGQSDGSGPTRMSHSPMATQSGYQQPLAPPSHMHPYKMGAHPGMVPPGGQQMAPYTPQGQQYPQGMDHQCRSSANTVALWNAMSCTVLYFKITRGCDVRYTIVRYATAAVHHICHASARGTFWLYRAYITVSLWYLRQFPAGISWLPGILISAMGNNGSELMDIDVIWACYIRVCCCRWMFKHNHLKCRRFFHVLEGNIIAGLMAKWCEGAEWIQWGQNRVERFAAVNTAVNCWIAQRAQDLLSPWVTGVIWTRAMCHGGGYSNAYIGL